MEEKEIKFTQKEIDEEAEKLRERIIVMRASEIMDNLEEYSMEHPKRSILPVDYMDRLVECPECGSAKILMPTRDSDEYDFTTVDKAYIYYCDDCGHRFDEPNYADILSYWFINADWASDLEEHGEHIIYNDSPCPIWCRRTAGQSISQDGVFQHMAEESLKKKWLATQE